MHARTILAVTLLLTAPLAGCIVPQNMQALREDLGYASLDPLEIDLTIRAETTTPSLEQPVRFTAEIQGAPDANVTWSIQDEPTHNGTTLEHRFQEPGLHTLHATARTPNATAHDTINVTVQDNQAPQANITLPNHDALTTDDPVTLSAEASTDPDGDPLTYRWTHDGDEIGTRERIQLQPGPGLHTVHLTVQDDHDVDTATQRFTVDQPLSEQATLTPTNDTHTLTLTAHESIHQLHLELDHTTTLGLETIQITLLDEDEPLATATTDPDPGASSAHATLTSDELTPGAYVLEATLERGLQTDLTLEGTLAYALDT